jgi:hypothetical protein
VSSAFDFGGGRPTWIGQRNWRYLVSGNNQFGRVNFGRATAAGAFKKAKEL